MAQAELRVDKAETGDFIFKINDTYLQSKEDPKKEPRVQIKKLYETGELKNLVVFGYDFGYTVDAVRYFDDDINVFLFEPNPTIFKIAHSTRKDLHKDENTHFSTEVPELEKHLHQHYNSKEKIHVFINARWEMFFNAQAEDFKSKIKRSIDNVRTSEFAKDMRYKEWTINLVNNLKSHVYNPSIHKLHNSLKTRNQQGQIFQLPAVICASGPSLYKQLKYLKKLQNKVIIIALNSSLAALDNEDIIPDFVMSIESYNVKSMFEGLNTHKTTLVHGLISHPELQNTNFKHHITFGQNASFYEEWIQKKLKEPMLFDIGGSVACSAFSLAFLLGASPIILIGQDLAFTNNKLYSRGTKYDNLHFKINEDGTYEYKNKKKVYEDSGKEVNDEPIKKQIKWVPGYYGGKVPTNAHFTFFQTWFESAAHAVKTQNLGVELINSTEGGANIKGFKNIPFKKMYKKYVKYPTHNFKDIIGKLTPIPDQDKYVIEEFKNIKNKIENEDISDEQLREEVPLFKAFSRRIREDKEEVKKHREEFKILVNNLLLNFEN